MPPMMHAANGSSSSKSKPTGLNISGASKMKAFKRRVKASASVTPAEEETGDTAGDGSSGNPSQRQRRMSKVGSRRSMKTSLTLQEKVWFAFESDLRIVIPIMVMIVLSTVSFILETADTGHLQYIWDIIDMTAVVVFTAEYVIRFAACPPSVMNKFQFFISPMNLIDLLSIVPTYAKRIGELVGESAGGGSLTGMKAIRLVRVFRIFKMGRYSVGIQIFLGAIKNSLISLSILGFLMLIAMILFASLMYYAEYDQNQYYQEYWSAQEEFSLITYGVPDGPFSSIPECFWWAIVTMTTVGYGDASPITPLGRTVATSAMVCGIIILALPISVLGSNFNKMVDAYAEETAAINSVDLDGSGFIDEEELRMWLVDQKRMGKIPSNSHTTAEALLKEYDTEGNGGLHKDEFVEMASAIMNSDDEYPTPRVIMEQLQTMSAIVSKLDQRLEAIQADMAVDLLALYPESEPGSKSDSPPSTANLETVDANKDANKLNRGNLPPILNTTPRESSPSRNFQSSPLPSSPNPQPSLEDEPSPNTMTFPDNTEEDNTEITQASKSLGIEESS